MRDITPIIKEIAEQELGRLRKQLIENLDIPGRNIETMAVNGDLENVIGTYFSDYSNLSFVLGPGIGQFPHNGSCRNTISTLIKISARPIFLISGFITIIEDSKVWVIADKEKSVPQAYINFLGKLRGESGNRKVEIISSDNRNTVRIDRVTVDQFTDKKKSFAGKEKVIEEHIMIKRMVR